MADSFQILLVEHSFAIAFFLLGGTEKPETPTGKGERRTVLL